MPRPVQNPRVPLDLAARTLELVDVPSESRHEESLAELVRASVPLDLVYDDDLTLLFRRPAVERPLVVFAGHLDTVPANDNLPGRIDGGAVHGLGASDMKGGLAVMVELARWAADGRVRSRSIRRSSSSRARRSPSSTARSPGSSTPG